MYKIDCADRKGTVAGGATPDRALPVSDEEIWEGAAEEDCDRFVQATQEAWRCYCLAALRGESERAELYRESALIRARAASRCREKQRGWGLRK